MSSSVLLLISNLPDLASAQSLAEALISRRLAACVSLLSPCQSVYRWEGKLERASEIPVLIKTTQACYPALEAAIRELHPYELPEIVAIPVTAGLPAYLNWVNEETDSCAAN